MKRSTIILLAISTVLTAGFGMFMYFGPNMAGMDAWHTIHPIMWDSVAKHLGAIFTADYWTGMFADPMMNLGRIISLGLVLISIILVVAALINLIAKKRPLGIVALLWFLVIAFGFAGITLCAFYPNQVFANLPDYGPFGVIGYLLIRSTDAEGVKNLPIAIFGFVALGLILIGWILGIVAIIIDMARPSKKKLAAIAAAAPAEAIEEEIVEEVPTEEAPEEDVAVAPVGETAEEPVEEKEEPKEEPKAEEPKAAATITQGTAPIIVQYFYNNAPAQEPAAKRNVPVSEIQGNISGEKPLTAEDIRKIVREEMGPKEEKQPVIVAVPSPSEDKALTAEEIRAIISEEIAKGSEKEEAAPVEEPKAEPAITAAEIRQIINEEFARREAQATPKAELTPEIIREIIRSEMVPVPAVKEEKVAPVTVVVQAAELKKEEPKVEEPKVEEPKKEEPKEEPKPVAAPVAAPVVEEDAEKIIRIPFQTRIKTADKEMKENYNTLKSEIMSYGVKSRISNKGDTFRLHKITFVKLTVAGKSLKLYFALDPKDYKNSPIPVQDASEKGMYKDIPLVFKVKSELSVRRAKELIAAVMEKNGLEQGKVETKNWVKEVPDAKDSSEE